MTAFDFRGKGKERNLYFPFPLLWEGYSFPMHRRKRGLARARTLGVLLRVTASLCDICDLSRRTTRIHGHRWSSKEEEEEEKKLFLNFSRSSPSPSSFFIRPFEGREKTHGSKDLRIFSVSFAETSVFVELFFGTRSLVRVHFFGDRTGV